MAELVLPMDAEGLVPHRLPMRLVDRLIAVNGKDGIVEAQPSGQGPLTDAAGVLEDIAMVELIAQGYAALKGYLDRLEDKPVRQGFLVGIKNLNCLEKNKPGIPLRIEITTLAELGDFALAKGVVRQEDEVIAQGEIKVWIQ